MDRDINLDSIRALDEQIQEHERAVIQLKRTRNSLLNVSTLSHPRYLEGSFVATSFRMKTSTDYRRARMTSSSSAPTGFGSPWAPRSFGASGAIRSKIGRVNTLFVEPLHSIWCCQGGQVTTWNDVLRDALRDCATRGIIRRVHLESHSAALLDLSSPLSPPKGRKFGRAARSHSHYGILAGRTV